jgi:hypothetical protein
VPKAGGTIKHVVCDDAATLVYLANQSCIVLHPWLSCAGSLDFPDQMIFDFDSSTASDDGVVEGAHLLKEILDDLELPAYQGDRRPGIAHRCCARSAPGFRYRARLRPFRCPTAGGT